MGLRSGLQDFKTFSNELITIVGVTNATVKCNDWSAKDVKVTIVEDGRRPIIARDLFPHLKHSLNQSTEVLNFNKNQCPIKQKSSRFSKSYLPNQKISQKHLKIHIS